MGIYYLSADGHDGNDGLTPETAWQTISHANQAMHPGVPCCSGAETPSSGLSDRPGTLPTVRTEKAENP